MIPGCCDRIRLGEIKGPMTGFKIPTPTQDDAPKRAKQGGRRQPNEAREPDDVFAAWPLKACRLLVNNPAAERWLEDEVAVMMMMMRWNLLGSG